MREKTKHDKIEYYRIDVSGGTQYIAARSRQAVTDFLGDPENPINTAALSGYRLKTLRRVTKNEAGKAPYFKVFAKQQYKLCHDGTWLLGIAGVENPPTTESERL